MDRGSAGLPPDQHAQWAIENGRELIASLDQHEAALRRGVVDRGALRDAIEHNYGVLINALDAENGGIPGAEQTVAEARAARAALKGYMARCDAHALRHSPQSARACAAACARDYAEVRDVLRYPDQ